MMTSDAESSTRPESEREQAESWYVLAEGNVDNADAAPYADAEEIGQLGYAQTHLLRAIYHEMRHGHDQTAAHAAAIEKQTRALADLAGVLDRVALHLGDR